MAVSNIPFSANSHASLFCLLMLVLTYLIGSPVYGATYHPPTHVKHLAQSPYCTGGEGNLHDNRGSCTNEKNRGSPPPHYYDDHNRIMSLHVPDDSKSTLEAKSGKWIGTSNYVVTLGLGTPKRNLTLIFDTASNVTWIQCKPCQSCHEQEGPIFNPLDSQTYENVSCTSPQCSQDVKTGCTDNTCKYGVVYPKSTQKEYGVVHSDDSFSFGFYGTETLTLTTSTSDVFSNFAFGCGINNTGQFGGTAGLLSLGRGSPTLLTLNASKHGSFFSYCLPTSSSTSGTFVIGKDGVATTKNSAGIKYTPLVPNSNFPSLYFIQVTGIKIAGELLQVDESAFSSPGTIIDSGTAITRLQTNVYEALKMKFRQMMMNYRMITDKSEPNSLFDTCYDFTGQDTVVIPVISFVFAGDVEVPIELVGTLVDVGSSRFCLAFAGNSDSLEFGIFGTVQQTTLNVVYDVAGEKIGFGSGGCS